MTRTESDPIRFDPLDADLRASPYETYRRLRDEDPLHRVAEPGYWVLSRFEDVFRAARDTETFSSAQGLTYEPGEIDKLDLKPTIVMMDPPKHTTFRRLVSRGFTPRKVAEIEPAVRAFVRERVGRLVEAGTADFVEVLAKPVPSFVVAHYLGVPEEDRDRFDRWTEGIVQGNAAGSLLSDALEAVTELYGYFTELIERRRVEPGDDMISGLIDARIDDADITIEEILGYAFVMVAGGNDTATGLLGGTAELLTENPGQRQILLDDPGRIGPAVDEFLRLTSPVQGLTRTTTRPVEVHGTAIGEGEKVHLLYGSANRDPREFGPTVDQLDVGREPPRIMTFSSGPHFCLGAAAARLQGRVVIEELLDLAPSFRVDSAAGTWAEGAFVRRRTSLPFEAGTPG